MVFDLPQLYEHPSSEILLKTLDGLTLRPSSIWAIPPAGTGTTAITDRDKNVDVPVITRYLTDIVSSKLSWIDDEVAQEQIRERASARLSERCGRAGTSNSFAPPHILSGTSTNRRLSSSDAISSLVSPFILFSVFYHLHRCSHDGQHHRPRTVHHIRSSRFQDLDVVILTRQPAQGLP